MDATSRAYISFEAVVGFVASVGNGLVLLAIYKNTSLQTVTNCFIASLAIADFLVGLVVAPLAALSFLGLPHHFTGCVFTNSIIVALTQVSIFNLLAVAVERFFAINSPFAYQHHLTVFRAIMINVFVWIIGVMFGLIPLFGWNLKHELNEKWTCNFVTVIDMRYVVYFHFFGCIVIPLIIIVFIYTYIFVIVRKQMIQIAALEIMPSGQGAPRTSTSKLKKEIKAAKSLAIVIFLFALSWVPIHVLNTITLTCGTSCPQSLELLLVTIVLSHANSAMNPFLYAYGNSNFKIAFQKMFCRRYIDDFGTQINSSFPKPSNHATTAPRSDTDKHAGVVDVNTEIVVAEQVAENVNESKSEANELGQHAVNGTQSDISRETSEDVGVEGRSPIVGLVGPVFTVEDHKLDGFHNVKL